MSPAEDGVVEETEDTSQVFMKEARMLSELRHPDILQPLDYGKALIETQVHLYLATRFCPDENLADVMKMHHFSPREIASLVEQIATVLQYAHERSIIHRHVKPSNVFVHSSTETLENLDDPLSDASRDYGWPVGSNCKFDTGAYHIITPDANTYSYCEASNKAFSNFTFQVQLVVSKEDCGGISFHDNSSQPYLYLFLVCQDGTYKLDLVQNSNFTKSISHTSPAINKGTGQPNLIAVVVNADTISLYANNQLLDSLQDSVYNSTYSTGLVGLIAFPLNNTTEDIYSNAKVWLL